MITKYQNREKRSTSKTKVEDAPRFRGDFCDDEESWILDELVIRGELHALTTNLSQVLEDEPFLRGEEVANEGFWQEEAFVEDLVAIDLEADEPEVPFFEEAGADKAGFS